MESKKHTSRDRIAWPTRVRVLVLFNPAAEVGDCRIRFICLCEDSITLSERNRRGIFGSVMAKSGVPMRTRGNFSKNEQVSQQERTSKKLEGVVNSATPKDTEVNSTHGRDGFLFEAQPLR